MSLWDALQIKDKFVGNNKIKEMYLPEETLDSEGNYFDIGEFGRKIAHVNQHLFGVYNDEDMNAANRVAAGRLIMLYGNHDITKSSPKYFENCFGSFYNVVILRSLSNESLVFPPSK